ncbi:MAG: DoxX family protein [Acidobacteriota bacterium]
MDPEGAARGPEPPAARRGGVGIRLAAGHLGRVLLGLIFLVAGILKGLDPAEFARQIAAYGIIGPGAAGLAAPLFIALETTLGVALLAGFRPRAGAVVAAGLLAVFIAIEAYGMSRGRTEACGCFGAYLERTPRQVIAEDIAFIGLAGLCLWGLRPWRGARRGAAGGTVLAAAVLSLGFALASPYLPLDPVTTRLAQGRSLEDLDIEGVAPGLRSGRWLVALLDLSDPAATEAAAALDALLLEPGAPGVVALTPSGEEEVLAFTLQAFPGFDVHPVDRQVLKRLYRRLPRFFLVEDGRVVAVYGGAVPPATNLISSGAL